MAKTYDVVVCVFTQMYQNQGACRSFHGIAGGFTTYSTTTAGGIIFADGTQEEVFGGTPSWNPVTHTTSEIVATHGTDDEPPPPPPPPTDTDADSIPDSTDPDDDNDGFTDQQEADAGTNPLDATSQPPPPPPPPSASSCECIAEIERVYQRIDYVYTKSDYIIGIVTALQNQLTLLESQLQSTPATTNNPVLTALVDIASRVEAVRQNNLASIEGVIDNIAAFRDSNLQKIQTLIDDVLQANQNLATVDTSLQASTAAIQSNQQSILDVTGGITGLKAVTDIIKDIADGIKDDVKELKEPETIDEINLLGGMVNSGALNLSVSASKVLLTNLSKPAGLGRRFSRVLNQPDNFQFGFIWFRIANCYTLEVPLEWERPIFDVPEGATAFCYWLVPGATFQASVLEKIEVINLGE